ncbi:MAG: hypothetical protein COV43_04650 [Deltaproteobacteria bacterium CG11_big_fil_rev_8_21_14_0_20_42_23]|nr:MAG: hypothetical protein COV43_04650 [Deltaproteobacteria bacterium CG11_big_fil_rev_8_21_14_0_20_42_23]PJC65065.1 MAG: hypothetical protein CO021_01040 [Deltaproteobacteria bacterium CG_4_9_14_0_2_um_filter_42_21]
MNAGGKVVQSGLPPISAEHFNRLLHAQVGEEMSWMDTSTNPGTVDPEELVAKGEAGAKLLALYVMKDANGALRFSPQFSDVYRKVLTTRSQELVAEEKAKFEIIPLETKLKDLGLNETERAIVQDIREAGAYLEQAYRAQLGAASYAPKQEAGSFSLDELNHGPWCSQNTDPLCTTDPSFPPKRTSLYSDAVRNPDGSPNCDLITKKFSNPFSVVRDGKNGPEEVPYAVAYGNFVAPAAAALKRAATKAGEIGDTALQAYLSQTAEGFLSEKPFPFAESDKAWIAMKGKSKFFVRVSADETYWDPCALHAGYHLELGLIDEKANDRSAKFTTHIQSMEDEMARLSQGTYKKRPVAENLEVPEFVQVIEFTGNARSAGSTTIGQALPNWCGEDGKADDCGHRSAVYTNHLNAGYNQKEAPRMAVMLSEAALPFSINEEQAERVVLHEILHNTGPNYGNVVGKEGKTATEVFGKQKGMLEELKAETAAGHFISWLAQHKGLYSDEQRNQLYTRGVLWNLSHLKKALEHKTDLSNAGAYSRLSAIQFGWMVEQGALHFNPTSKTWDINYEKMPKAWESLMSKVMTIYASGDKKALDALTSRYWKGEGLKQLQLEALEEKTGKFPVRSIVYKVSE